MDQPIVEDSHSQVSLTIPPQQSNIRMDSVLIRLIQWFCPTSYRGRCGELRGYIVLEDITVWGGGSLVVN
jgi:hypothetical protein